MKELLCPSLGKYAEMDNPCCVVFMENVSTPMIEELEAAIKSTGEVLMYGPPHSPHFNPIEKYFFF